MAYTLSVVRYTTHGPVRGGCGHRHKLMRTAVACIDADRREWGGTDRSVFRCADTDTGRADLTDDESAEIVEGN